MIGKFKAIQLLNRKKLFWLFLICVFPIHFWAFLILIYNLSWLLRSGLWFMFGVFSYQLLLAFSEALLIFFILVFLSLLLPKSWSENEKILFLGNLLWVGWIGLVIVQYLSPNSMEFEKILLIAGVITFALFISTQYFCFRNNEIASLHLEIFDRIQVMSIFFLGCDGLGSIFMVIRNIFWIK